MRKVLVTLWAVVSLAAFSLPAPVMADTPVDPEVHVDPNAPANKEYQIPLEQARGTAGSTVKNAPAADRSSSGGGIGLPIAIAVAAVAVGVGAGLFIKSRSKGAGGSGSGTA